MEEISNNNQKSAKYQKGDILKMVKVRFPGHASAQSFLLGSRKFKYGEKVVAMSERGMAIGYVNSFPFEVPYDKSLEPVRAIAKTASQEDFEEDRRNFKKQKEMEITCNKLIKKYKLEMDLTHVELTQFGKKVVFYFIAPARVDFRELVKELVGELKMRIELRQISLRDRAAAMGAIGPCGRELCCSSFLVKYGNTSIKLAKNQNLSINYSQLNGVCGQLKCCLKYEDEVYTHKRKSLPPEGKIVKTQNGDIGKVLRLHLLVEQFDLKTTKGQIRRYKKEQFVEVMEGFNFPREFDRIIDETGNVIS